MCRSSLWFDPASMRACGLIRFFAVLGCSSRFSVVSKYQAIGSHEFGVVRTTSSHEFGVDAVQVAIYATNLNTVQVAIYPTNLNKYSASCNLHY